MFDSILQIVAPHHCYSCGKIGTVLCINCKYDIASEPFDGCIVCGRPTLQNRVCRSCTRGYTRGWMIGERSDTLKQLIDDYKFERVKAISTTLVDLLDETVSELPSDTLVVPIPTLSSHVRRRGFDHCKLISAQFARKRHLTHCEALVRRTKTVQRSAASRKERIEQAKVAFTTRSIMRGQTVLLIDDVMTTGATLEYAAKHLKTAGAGDVYVAVIARQPLD